VTSPADEEVKDGTGTHRDIVDVQIHSASVVLAARIARMPGAGAAGTAIVVSGEDRVLEVIEETGDPVEDWRRASTGRLTLTVDEPLARWSLGVDAPSVEASAELRALTPPAGLADSATASVGRAAGVERYSQLCEIRGTIRFGGRSRSLDGLGVRTHRWGPTADAGRTRFLTAATEAGTLLSIAAVRPPGASAHGEELVAGLTIAAANGTAPQPLPFETVRLSTVFDPRGAPVKAGAELFRPGEELPSRLAGTALAGAGAAAGGPRASLTLFALKLDGVPAFGLYEVEGA
jgi:hypothetical protein